MNTSPHSITLLSKSAEDTLSLGMHLGNLLSSGMVIALYGDLGSGKTVLVQGLAKGLSVPSGCYVTSPSYTLINEYPGRLPLFHIDLYRLETIDDIESLGVFDLFDEENVVAVEWAERIEDALPQEHLSLCFETLDNFRRKINITPYGLHASNVVMSLQRYNFIEYSEQ